jgi:hypothetical protein
MSKAFRLRPVERELAPALVLYLRRQGCSTELMKDGVIIVSPPHDLHEEQAELELRLYLRLWEVLHGTRISVLS